MCLILEFKTRKELRECKPKIAKKDIEVYKVLKRGCFIYNTQKHWISPYRLFVYNKGYHYSVPKLIKTVEKDSGTWTLNISEGLHSYTCLEKAKYKKSFQKDRYIKTMYIPKGSIYYIDKENKEIVSDNLIWY